MNRERKKAYAELKKHGNEADGFCGAPIMNWKRRRAAKRGHYLTRKDAHEFGEAGRVSKDLCTMQVQLVRGFSVFEAVLSGAGAEFLPAIVEFLNASAEAKRGEGSLCLACDTEFSPTEMPIDFSITTAGEKILLTGICCRCAELDDERLLKVSMQRLKKIWTDAVELPAGKGVH